MSRTSTEEAALDRICYLSAHYFSPEQWLSHLAQINLVRELQPSKVLEVGIGNGLTSLVLKGLGFDVTTADINPDLCPDRVADVLSLSQVFGERAFDVVLCAEVLEHLPYESVDRALHELAAVSRQWVVLTVPQPARQLLYLEAKMPRLPSFKIDWKVRSRAVDTCHHWELGAVPVRRFEAKIARHSQIERTGHVPGNHYHRYYVLRAGIDRSSLEQRSR